jgi:Ras-related protein Rab-1A
MMFFETSAKTADGVEEAFRKIATKLMAKRD